LTTKINDTVAEIFGYETIEFNNYHIDGLDTLHSLTSAVGEKGKIFSWWSVLKPAISVRQ
jgi:hypothetical protein